MNQERLKRKFIRKYAPRFEAEVREKKESRHRQILQILSRTSNLTILILSAALISLVWQLAISTPYLTSPAALGKHYFNALTYANFVTHNLPLPMTSWLPFWNEGSPMIGGEPTLFFYSLYPLTKIFDIATSLELAAIVAILLFLLASHFLFWELSRNHLFSLILTGILLITPATYELLISEGDFSATSIQWYLPAILFTLTRFLKTRERQLLAIAAVLSAIAVLVHPPMAISAILIPSFLFFLLTPLREKALPKSKQRYFKKPSIWKRLKIKVGFLILFLILLFAIGSTGFFALYKLYYQSQSLQPCSTVFCRGQYPQDLRWFSPLILIPFTICLITTLLALGNKSQRFFMDALSLTLTLIPLTAFTLAAYLGLIDLITSIILPQNLFWAITLLVLAFSAAALRFIATSSRKLAIAAISTTVFLTSITLLVLPSSLKFNLEKFSAPAIAHPLGVESFIVTKYQTGSIADVIPDWLPLDEKNLRIDSVTSEFASWWNAISETPLTRGYSRNIPQKLLDWQHYLHFTTAPADPLEEISDAARLNRTLFMLDHFAVGFIQHPHESVAFQGIGYNPSLLVDPQLIKRKQTVVNSTFFKLYDNLTSPIVAPTNAPRILVISNEGGYQSFIRAIALLNLNSKFLIPIKGPQSIDELDQELLNQADALILYQFTGENWQGLEKFIASGGNLYIDLSSRDYQPTQMPPFLGIENLDYLETETNWNLKTSTSELLNQVNTTQFAPLLYKHDPWKIAALPSDKRLPEWLKPILFQANQPILATGKLNASTIIFSGINLPFHIVSYENDNELTLFKNILNQLAPAPQEIGDYSLKRFTPSSISVSARNAHGIYFKENYHPGWQAYVNQEKTNLYQAGLGFMYLPLPSNSESETVDVLLEFRGDRTTWILTALTLTGLLFALIYSLTLAPFEAISKLTDRKITRPLKRWWAKEEI